jgi:hypothetical protein
MSTDESSEVLAGVTAGLYIFHSCQALARLARRERAIREISVGRMVSPADKIRSPLVLTAARRGSRRSAVIGRYPSKIEQGPRAVGELGLG